MSELLEGIRRPVSAREVRISEHGFDELSVDGIGVQDTIRGIGDAIAVEEYPASGRGPAVLVLEFDGNDQPIHVVWSIPQGHDSPAVLVTGYRPSSEQWEAGFTRRRR